MGITETPEERRNRYLKMAAKAEVAAAKIADPKAKAAWIDLAVSWMLMASEIPSQQERSRKRRSGGG
jgi:hypothetical protein